MSKRNRLDPRMKRNKITALLVGLALFSSGWCTAQENEKEASVEHERLMATLGVQEEGQAGNPGESVWKFGIRVTANGAVRGITATFPIPIEWPEQAVVEIRKEHSDHVNRMSVKRLTREVQQMIVKINRLDDGEVAEATVTFRVTKSGIDAPDDPSQYRLASKVPSSLRKYLQPSPFIESKNRVVKAAAASIEFADDASDWEKVEQIYQWVRENVEYKFDTQIHSCMDALESGHGDCEELSSLFIAICRINKIPARAVWIPGHTFPEFYMEDGDGNGHWIPCQAAGTYAFGVMHEARPVLQKGDKFKVPGTSEPSRYVQPTLVAKEVEGAPTLEWISEPVVDAPSEDE